MVVMPGNDQIRLIVVECVPERMELGLIARTPRSEAWVMDVGQRAGCGVGGQIGAQPLFLG